MKIRDIIDREQETLSMEVFPPKKDTDFEMVKEAALHIASLKPSFMSVTYGAGGSTKGNTIKLASEIQKQYQVPAMAHLTCVCATKESINTALTEMKQAGIENILALRGDIPKDYDGEVFTEFQHASQLVELIKKTGDFCVGGACYPEVHPDSKNKFDDIFTELVKNYDRKHIVVIEEMLKEMHDSSDYSIYLDGDKLNVYTGGRKPIVFIYENGVFNGIFRDKSVS